MAKNHSGVITAEAVKKAAKLIVGTIDNGLTHQQHSPAFDQLAAARQETDPAKRVAKKTEALKKGLQEARATTNRLRRQLDDLEPEFGKPEFTPEAEREMDLLKETIRNRIREKAEEQIARNYPEIASDKKRRAPRRHRINV